jgi:hypothetical protein
MNTFESLEAVLEGMFDTPFSELPKSLQVRVNEDFHPWPWEKMDADQRRNHAQAWDFQNDPTKIELRDGITHLTASDSPGYSLDEAKRLRGDYLDKPLREETKPEELPPLEWESSPQFEVLNRVPPAADTPREAQVFPKAIGRKKWTPEKLAELVAYREAHTMSETAAEFGITEQRIRQLLPREKPLTTHYSGLIHRSK